MHNNYDYNKEVLKELNTGNPDPYKVSLLDTLLRVVLRTYYLPSALKHPHHYSSKIKDYLKLKSALNPSNFNKTL